MFVAGIYFYLRKITPSSISYAYTYLTLTWIFLAATAFPSIIRNMFPPSMPQVHIWNVKMSMVAGSFAFACQYMFIGTFYINSLLRYFFYFLGWVVTVPLSFINTLYHNYFIETSIAGIKVYMPPFAYFTSLFAWSLLIGSFAVTMIYLYYHLASNSIKTKVIKICGTYVLFWLLYSGESFGIFFSLLGGTGILLIRFLLGIMALITIVVWTGKRIFLQAVSNLFVPYTKCLPKIH